MRPVRVHADGLARCSWLNNDPLYINYHDTEWGVPDRDQRALFEAICLEGFQAGLSWFTILKRRESFRQAFDNFDTAKVARYSEAKVAELMQDSGIIRNTAKIRSAINNAKVVQEKEIDLVKLIWSFAPEQKEMGDEVFEWRATSPESDALSKELKSLGFSFVGSTTMYALMQSSGVVRDHALGCFRRD